MNEEQKFFKLLRYSNELKINNKYFNNLTIFQVHSFRYWKLTKEIGDNFCCNKKKIKII